MMIGKLDLIAISFKDYWEVEFGWSEFKYLKWMSVIICSVGYLKLLANVYRNN